MLSAELAQWLDDNGFGTYDAAGITGIVFLENQPESPDTCITIYSTGGYQGDVKTALKRPTLQLHVRGGSDPNTAFDLAESIHSALHAQTQTVFIAGGETIHEIVCAQSAPIRLGPDGNGRHRYTINLELIDS
jgi:hypothetical protein